MAATPRIPANAARSKVGADLIAYSVCVNGWSSDGAVGSYFRASSHLSASSLRSLAFLWPSVSGVSASWYWPVLLLNSVGCFLSCAVSISSWAMSPRSRNRTPGASGPWMVSLCALNGPRYPYFSGFVAKSSGSAIPGSASGPRSRAMPRSNLFCLSPIRTRYCSWVGRLESDGRGCVGLG